jgi:hypothetical protein
MTSTECDIDLELIDKVLELIPPDVTHLVVPALVGSVVDAMTSEILKSLTGDPSGFDKAEEILMSYYQGDNALYNLIQDSFKILGSENTLYLLDAMQLNKYIEFKQQEQEQTNA